MPTYDYLCEACNRVFEKSFMKIEDTKTDCEKCRGSADRIPSAVNIGKSNTSRETADIAIGKLSEKRWEGIKERKAQTEKMRKESGQVAIARTAEKVESGAINYEYKPVSKEHLDERKSLYSEYRKHRKSY